MSAKYRIAKQIERTLARCPEIRAVFVDYDGNEYGVLGLLPPAMRRRVVFAKNAKMKDRVETELPPPRGGEVEEKP